MRTASTATTYEGNDLRLRLHALTHQLFDHDLDGLYAYCGTIFNRRDMHDVPQPVTCLHCLWWGFHHDRWRSNPR